jgi:hypothetical protein
MYVRKRITKVVSSYLSLDAEACKHFVESARKCFAGV